MLIDCNFNLIKNSIYIQNSLFVEGIKYTLGDANGVVLDNIKKCPYPLLISPYIPINLNIYLTPNINIKNMNFELENIYCYLKN